MEANERTKQEYAKMVERTSPKSPIGKNCLLAFLSGGAICTLGQIFRHWYFSMGWTEEECGLLVSVTLIGLSAVLTALGIYGRLGKHCGAGTEVPITGFANSVVSPAIEFKKEGMVLGMAAKMFLIAGPVIVYGTLTSMVVGVIYYLLGR